MIEDIYRRIRWLYPKKYIKWLEKDLSYAGIEVKIEKFITLSFLYSLVISLLIFLFIFYFGRGLVAGLVILPCFVGLQLLFDLVIVMIGDKRGSFAESVLPDALQLMSANIRSGLTPDKALLFSARPEFGILEKEIKLAASKAVAGEPIEDALLALGGRIKSRIVNRTFTLIVEGMKKGGELASLLEQTANDIRDLKILKKEIAAQVGMYAIFLLIAIGFAAPLLFAFSSYLVETMIAVGSEIRISEATHYAAIGTLKLGLMKISPDFLRVYSLLTLIITSFFGSLLIGLLQEGREKAGIKYIPILLLLNMTIYFTVRIALLSIIGVITPTSVIAR
jgi:archaellum biogenesis protein FlaJ (TadC family)